jgi:hypothetical protein
MYVLYIPWAEIQAARVQTRGQKRQINWLMALLCSALELRSISSPRAGRGDRVDSIRPGFTLVRIVTYIYIYDYDVIWYDMIYIGTYIHMQNRGSISSVQNQGECALHTDTRLSYYWKVPLCLLVKVISKSLFRFSYVCSKNLFYWGGEKKRVTLCLLKRISKHGQSRETTGTEINLSFHQNRPPQAQSVSRH